jgi:hypothetical protein
MLDEALRIYYEYFSESRIPTILHICQESRVEAWKIYQPIFNITCSTSNVMYSNTFDMMYLPWSEFTAGSTRMGRFNPEGCIISNLTSTMASADIQKITRLAVDIEIWNHAWKTTADGKKVSRFGNLKELVMVFDGCQKQRGSFSVEEISFSVAEKSADAPFWLSNLHAVIEARLREEKQRFPAWDVPQWRLRTMRKE